MGKGTYEQAFQMGLKRLCTIQFPISTPKMGNTKVRRLAIVQTPTDSSNRIRLPSEFRLIGDFA